MDNYNNDNSYSYSISNRDYNDISGDPYTLYEEGAHNTRIHNNTEGAYSGRDGDYTDSPKSFNRRDIHRMVKTGRPRGNTFNASSARNEGYDSPRNRPRGSSFNVSSDWRESDDSANHRAQRLPNPPVSKDLIIPNQSEHRGRALYNFKGEQEGDLSFHRDDIITIVQKTDT